MSSTRAVGLEVHGVQHGLDRCLDSVQTGDQVVTTEMVEVSVSIYGDKTPQPDGTSTDKQDR